MKADWTLILAMAGIGLLAVSALTEVPSFIWNRTASMPEGLYVIHPQPGYKRGMIVAYRPSQVESDLLEERSYTGRGWPLIKRVAAVSGDTVCRDADRIEISGTYAATAAASDAAGRPLPVWQGCRSLGQEDVFLLGDDDRSVDGRYFGMQDARRILGEARLLTLERFGTKAEGNPASSASDAPPPDCRSSDGG